ncbi:MAG: hypothetical protein JNL74_19585, partial [Fibrobacteres bacterium]|nr:hypothetical protein [Fibrobacterota bacterium]
MPRTPLMVICSLIIFLIISSVYPSQNTSDTGQQYTDTLIGFQIPYTDSQIVRIFLDTNGLNNIPVNQVAKFRDSKAISIDIKEKNITIVPDLIGQLYDIETINLYGNSIDSIPASICQLRLLRSLVLARNKLTHLPEDIGEIDSLYSLHVETNMLINIPASIGKLKKLRYLALTENRLTSLPKEIGNLSDLQTLWLVKNNIQSLPQEIGQLKSLKELFAWDNKLTSIPKELSTLSSLEHGAFGNNLLTSIPVEICTLPKVSRLEFTGNKIVSIPADFFKLPFLSRVEFGYNCLTSIPSTILARTFSTYYVDFGSNKLCTVSDSITAWLNKYDSDWKKTQECGNTKIVYVKQSASGANNGTSWSNAFRKLQDALSIVSYGDEIWVAEGTYKPTDTINQSRSFVLGTGISLYGGFSGTETSREERSFSRYKSILTGDILNNDFCFKYMNDNVYHVVHNNGKAKLDGFLIRGGEANDSRDYYGHGCDFTNLYGGGVYADGDSLVIANCIFTGNSASTRNGFQDSLMGTPSGCGGAIAIWSGDVRIENSLFVNNYADSGGAIFLSRGRVNIINSTFYNNAASEGGAIYNQFRMI